MTPDAQPFQEKRASVNTLLTHMQDSPINEKSRLHRSKIMFNYLYSTLTSCRFSHDPGATSGGGGAFFGGNPDE